MARVRFAGGRCGKRLYLSPTMSWVHAPHEGIRIGDDVQIGNQVTIEAPPGARLSIDSRTHLTRYIVVSAVREITIGSDCMVAEFVSIRDSDHGMQLGMPMMQQPIHAEPTSIGNDVWVGRGVAVLRGAHIGDGAVLAANAVVRGSFEANSVVAGVPASVKKLRL